MDKIFEKLHTYVNGNINCKYEYSRENAWNYCYNAFRDALYKKMNSEVIDVEKLSLILSSYLANWGMFRNSFLLETDYKVHNSAINIILDEWDFDVVGLDCRQLQDENHLERLDKLYTDIRDYYGGICESLNNRGQNENEEKKEKHVTDTMVTKILLGTTGCVPAFDECFKKGLSQYKDKGLKCTQAYKKDNIRQLAIFFEENETKFLKVIGSSMEASNGISYPAMKIVDMAFWQIGRDIIDNGSDNKKK